MNRLDLLDYIEKISLDTSAMDEKCVAGFHYGLKLVKKYLGEQPMDDDDCRDLLERYYKWFEEDVDVNSPEFQKFDPNKVLEAMRRGALAIRKRNDDKLWKMQLT